MTTIPQDSDIVTVEDIRGIKEALAELRADRQAAITIRPESHMVDPSRFITFTQAVLGIVSAMVLFAGIGFGYVSGVQSQIELAKEWITKVEYQNTLSIDDRLDLHRRTDKTDASVSEIKTTLATIMEMLSQIRARQGK